MDRKWLLIIGGLAIIYGTLLLLGQVFNFNGWALFFPLLLIALGVWLILRPRTLGPSGQVQTRLLGDIIRSGAWQVVPEEIWLAIGDIHLDLSQASIPEGETTITVFGFVNDIRVTVPDGVGIALHCSAFVSDLKMYDDKETTLFMPLDRKSDDYDACPRKVIIRTNHFVADIKVRRPRK
ncbi:MAG: cell wall-active antibiotics response protein [Anaerolineaceae bacterium]|nr:cell wall-active antibiotics response protein [Anaerolineaceae bacterium]